MEHSTLKNLRQLVLALLVSSGAIACADQAAPSPDETNLVEVSVPTGATLATTKSAALEVAAAKAGKVEIRRLDDKVLYRGALAANGTLSVNVWLPTKDEDVLVKFVSDDDPRESTVHLSKNANSVSFN